MLYQIFQPLILIVVLGLWVYCLVDALRHQRSWFWVLFVLLTVPWGVPVYFWNFKLGSREPEGRLDKAVGTSLRLKELERKAETLDVPSVHLEIAEIHVENGDYQKALKALKRVLDLHPEDLRAQYLAGGCFVALQRPGEATAHLEYVLEEDPRYAYGEARQALANAYLQLKDEERAFREFGTVVEQWHLPESVVRHAMMLRQRGEEDKAREELQELLSRKDGLHPDIRKKYQAWFRQAEADLNSLG